MTQIEALLDHARATRVSLHIFHLTSSGLARTPAYLARIDKFLKELIWMARTLRHGREHIALE